MDIRVIKFETEYPAGKDPVDKVLIAPSGAAFDKTRTWHRINHIRPPARGEVDQRTLQSDHFAAMCARWDVIGPAYQAWKEGTEIPETGTPLAAWAGVSEGQVRALNAMGIRTVEDVAEMGEQAVSALRFPNARQLPKLAADYLKGADAADKDRTIAEMTERMAAMEALLEEVTAAKAESKPKAQRAVKDSEAA